MLKCSIQRPPLPGSKDNRLLWGSLPGSSASLAVGNLAIQQNTPLLIIAPDMHAAARYRRELAFFTGHTDLPILQFPDWETLPYDHFSPHEDLISDRLSTLYRLPKLQNGIIVAALPTLMHRVVPRQYIESQTFLLSVGEKLDLIHIRQQLIAGGYRNVSEVMEHGEFAFRGSIIDIYPMGSTLPFRIELFDDSIETIRTFDTDTQRSIEKMQEIRLLPAHEYPLSEDGITHFRQAWRARFAGNPLDSPLYEHISAGNATPGIEYYLPLFFEKTETFFDYLPENTVIVLCKKLQDKATEFWKEASHRYEQLRYDTTRPLCEPKELFLPVDQCFAKLKPFKQIILQEEPLEDKPAGTNFSSNPSKDLPMDHREKQPLKALQNYIDKFDARILFCAESMGRREILLDLLNEIQLTPKLYNTWNDFLTDTTTIGITVAPLDHGLQIEEPKIALITESQLFGKQVIQRRLRQRREQDPNAIIRNLTELNMGAAIVHIHHGVGRYRGLRTIKTGDIEGEYLTLEYANQDKIYVPVTSLHLISRYTGSDPENAPLQKLGSRQWEKIKDRATKRIRDVAAELLDIYGRRKAATGFAFPKPDKDFLAFREAFPFEETPDQTLAIDDVINDMTSPRSMDRLICGDVGFGKTEVAMQAAFLAVQATKQVAILVPTTLLSAQHLQNFQDRFADWPIKIAALSRLQTPKEQATTIKGLADGAIDIVIGTHKLLGKEIVFKDLGLLVVDEEHRFGVRQKERVKSLRAHIDILTLTATPIPRTLNMSLIGTRDLSIIATPPEKRLAIKTFVHETSSTLTREAILREAMRGGQVYYLHNEVATIQATAEKLGNAIPEARIAIAHGQMRERELERVMSDFYHQKFNLLVCTTIIESGIDVPSANTIIINRADKFGLAQLHQLRGRVGRSHHQAYAYLLTPPEKVMTRDAKKRLDAIRSMGDLGAGFTLATHDLEIRGAGELLGEEQSGQIHAIGFALYMELLDEAVKALKEGRDPAIKQPLQQGPEIDLHVTALIPETYVMDVHTRLTLYKRLASCDDKDGIQTLKAEMVDRFGLLPEPTETLFKLANLKLKIAALGIKKVDIGKDHGSFHFDENPNVDPSAIVKLIQNAPDKYQLMGADKLRFSVKTDNIDSKIAAASEMVRLLK